MSSCPTGYTNTSGSCTATQKKIFEIFLDKIIKGSVVDTVSGLITVQTGISSQFYPHYDITDPYAGKNRGYYFNGYSSYMTFLTSSNNQYQLVLSPALAMQFWLFPVNYGVIFAKQSNNQIGFLLEITPSFNVKLTILLSNTNTLAYYTSVSILNKSN